MIFVSPKKLELWMDQRMCAEPPPWLVFPYLNHNPNFNVCSCTSLEIVTELEITALFLSSLHLLFVSVRKMLCQWIKVLCWNAELTAENFCIHSLVPYFKISWLFYLSIFFNTAILRSIVRFFLKLCERFKWLLINKWKSIFYTTGM